MSSYLWGSIPWVETHGYQQAWLRHARRRVATLEAACPRICGFQFRGLKPTATSKRGYAMPDVA
jgi:hypothetical protein